MATVTPFPLPTAKTLSGLMAYPNSVTNDSFGILLLIALWLFYFGATGAYKDLGKSIVVSNILLLITGMLFQGVNLISQDRVLVLFALAALSVLYIYLRQPSFD